MSIIRPNSIKSGLQQKGPGLQCIMWKKSGKCHYTEANSMRNAVSMSSCQVRWVVIDVSQLACGFVDFLLDQVDGDSLPDTLQA